MDRINGHHTIDIGDGRRGFRAEDLPDGIPGTEITADWLNGVQEELAAIVGGAGYPLSPDSHTQALRAIRSGRHNWVTASGGPAELTAVLEPPPTSISDMLGLPLRVVAVSANTGPVTLRIAGLPALPVVAGDDGKPLIGHDWSARSVLYLVCDGAAWRLLSPQRRRITPLLFYGSL